MTNITYQVLMYNGIRIVRTDSAITALNQRFDSVDEAISFIDRNFYQ